MRNAWPWLWMLLVVSCECGADGERVDGAHPYIRCLALDAEDRVLDEPSGTIEDGLLTLDGIETLEFFSLRGSSLDWLEASSTSSLQIVLGGFAREERTAVPLLQALAARGPALLLPGGEDDLDVFDEALDEVASPTLIDLRGIRRIDLGPWGFVVVPGAPDGRYARGEAACGFSPADLELLDGVAENGDRTLSWAAPRGAANYDVGLLGQHVGVVAIRELEEREELRGGVYAWPRESAGAIDDETGRFVVASPGALHIGTQGERFLGEALRARITENGLSI